MIPKSSNPGKRGLTMPTEVYELIGQAATIYFTTTPNPTMAKGRRAFMRLALAERLQRHPTPTAEPSAASTEPPVRRRITERSEKGSMRVPLHITDELWAQAQAAAAQQGISVSKLITDAALSKARRVLAQHPPPTVEL